MLDALIANPALARGHRVWAVRADLLRRLGEYRRATHDYDRAIALVDNDVDRRYLTDARTHRGELMPHAENTITVDRPIGDVFAYLADGTNNPRWRSGVLSIERTSSTEQAGATYQQKLRGPGGRPIDGDYRITTYQPPT